MPPDLTILREKITRLETGGTDESAGATISLGLPAVDGALPGGGLRAGAVHELMFPHPADGGATTFALHVLSRLARPESRFLWAGCRDDLHGPGFVAAGFDPAQVLFARTESLTDVFWAAEEGLRCPALTAIVADGGDMDFTLSRRLSLAAAASGGTLLMLQPYRQNLPASAAATRWRIASTPGGGWQLDLLRCKGGRPRHWRIDPATDVLIGAQACIQAGTQLDTVRQTFSKQAA